MESTSLLPKENSDRNSGRVGPMGEGRNGMFLFTQHWERDSSAEHTEQSYSLGWTGHQERGWQSHHTGKVAQLTRGTPALAQGKL